MKVQLMDIKRQHETYSEEYEEAVLKVLRSGNYIGGDEVSEFEKEFAAYEGAKFGVSCGNGTEALVLAMKALGIGDGDEVITVSWTFFATAESIASVGARPVFVDVDEDTFCIDVKQIEKAITNKTKAVLPVHFYGQSCDMDEIKAICKRHNLFLITDCAQSTGTEYKGSRKNTLGDVACFSFFPTKNLGCDGDGGMVLTDNEEIARICRSLKAHGSGRDGLFALKKSYERKGEAFPEDMPIGESKYYNYLIGYNSRLDAIQAAILRKKLRHIDEFVFNRRNNAHFYTNALKETSYVLPIEKDDRKHSYYIYAVRHKRAEEIMGRLQERGIQCGTYYPVPLHLQGAFRYLGYKKGDFPITEKLCCESFAIPVFPELKKEEMQFIIDCLKEFDDER